MGGSLIKPIQRELVHEHHYTTVEDAGMYKTVCAKRKIDRIQIIKMASKHEAPDKNYAYE
jgi:hypothetical protein